MNKIVLLVVTGLFFFSLFLYLPFMTPYLISLGVTATLAGAIVGARAILQIALRFPLGLGSQALGKQKIFVVIGMVLAALSALVMYFYPTPVMMAVGSAISGAASTMFVAFTMLYEKYDDNPDASKAVREINNMTQAGMFAAFLLGGFMYQFGDIRALFLISFLVALCGAIASLFVQPKPSPKSPITRKAVKEVVGNKQLITFSVLGILLKAVVFATAFSFTPKIAHDIGASGIEIGIANALFIGASILGSALMGTKRGERFSVAVIGVAGFVLLAAYAILVPYVGNIEILMAIQVIGGIGYAGPNNVFMAHAIGGLRPELKTGGMGFYQATYSIGSTIGPILLGIFADRISYEIGFAAIAGVAIIGAVLTLVAARITRKRAAVHDH